MSKDQQAISYHKDDGWYGSIFEESPVGLFVFDSAGLLVDCNRAFAESLGYDSTAEIKSRPAIGLFPDLEHWPAFFKKLRQKEAVTNEDWCTRTKQGNQLWFQVSIRAIRAAPTSWTAVGTALDITERKIEDTERMKHLRLTASIADLGQETLRGISGINLQEVVAMRVATDLEVDSCLILEPGGLNGDARFVAGAEWSDGRARIIAFNQGTPAGFGLSAPHGADPSEPNTGVKGPWHFQLDERFASVMSVAIGNEQCPRGFICVHSKTVRYFDDQEVSFLQSAANLLAAAITQQETDQELRTSEERLRLAMDAAALGIWDQDLASGRVTWTRSQALLFGLPSERLVGTYAEFQAVIHPEDLPQLNQALERARAEKRSWSHEYRIRRHDGVRWIAGQGQFIYDREDRPYRVAGVTMDISDRRRLEEQYRHAQKMEAVGRFAGGVAHDFNNLLTVINGYADMLMEMLPARSEPYELVDQIRHAGERGANLTRQILAFSKHKGSVPRVLDLNSVIVNMESMLCRLVGEDLEFQTSLAERLYPVKLDPAQLDQIVVNLVINARDAMPGGGLLSISTKNAELSELDVCGHLDAKPGRYSVLSISDTGVGMDAATCARVFEPFFTTKGSHGTGLGLATVHRIVHQAGGFIEVLSRPGDGTWFQVFLPGIAEPLANEISTQPHAPHLRGNETVLLVEDEEGVRRLACHALQQAGFHVLEAPNGSEALEISRRHKGRIHLLVSDVVMPRMSGRELANQLQKTRPKTKVLYMSGYVDDALVHHGVLNEEAVFLQKPFDAAGLTAMVREALARRP